MGETSKIARGFLVLFCVFFFACTFSYLLHAGRLAVVPIYDDVSYLIDAISRLGTLEYQGLGGFLRSFTVMPAHSPVFAVIGTFGLLFSATEAWGPYALNALWLLAFAVLAWRALGRIPDWSRVGIIMAMLAAPMFGYVISEFRPDIVWGLLIGFAVALLASVDLAVIRLRAAAAYGLLIGVAVLTKPSGMPAAIVVLGTGMVLQFGIAFLTARPAGSKATLVRFAIMLCAALAPIVLYMIFSWRHVWDYIYSTLIVEKGVWSLNASTIEHIVFYLVYPNAFRLLGWVWYACIPILIICAAVLIHFRQRQRLLRLAGLVLTVLVAYLIPTASSVKTFYIGSIFYGPVIAVTVWALGAIVEAVRPSPKIVGILGAAVFTAAWTPKTGSTGLDDPRVAIIDDASKAILPEIIATLKTREPGKRSTVLFTSPGPVYSGTLEFMSLRQGLNERYINGYTWSDWSLYEQAFSFSDIVISPEPGILGQDGFNFPSFAFQQRILDEMRHDPAFDARRAYIDPNGKAIWIFTRKASFPMKKPVEKPAS